MENYTLIEYGGSIDGHVIIKNATLLENNYLQSQWLCEHKRKVSIMI